MVARISAKLPKALFVLLIAAIVAFLLFPVFVVIPISFNDINDLRFPPVGFSLRWYEAFMADPFWKAAFLTSLQVALMTVVASVSLGTAAALALFMSDLRLKPALRLFLLSPLVTPVIVLAIGIFMVFSRWKLAGTITGLVVAHSVLAIPLVIVAVTAALHTIPPNLAMASAGLGAGPVRTFFRIRLPLLKPGVVAGAVFAFITSWDEAVISIFLSSPSHRTLPVLIWSGVRTGLSPVIAAVGSILIIITAVGLALVYALRPADADNRQSL
ncbi:Binding-protein-dependent transport systems inner membrane component [Mesorhizobium sp. SOD10]|nr:Binding-protein-dependent transport systems inner membrane component [Mesorhizobium sp. SOD10]